MVRAQFGRCQRGGGGLHRSRNEKGTLQLQRPFGHAQSGCYLSGVAAAGVGTPAALIAVIVAVCWKIVCRWLAARRRVRELPGETGSPCRKSPSTPAPPAAPLHVAGAAAIAPPAV